MPTLGLRIELVVLTLALGCDTASRRQLAETESGTTVQKTDYGTLQVIGTLAGTTGEYTGTAYESATGRAVATLSFSAGGRYTYALTGEPAQMAQSNPDASGVTLYPLRQECIGDFNDTVAATTFFATDADPPLEAFPAGSLESEAQPAASSYSTPDPPADCREWPFFGDNQCTKAPATCDGVTVTPACKEHDRCYGDCALDGSTRTCNDSCIGSCNDKLGTNVFVLVFAACWGRGGSFVDCVRSALKCAERYKNFTNWFGGVGCNACGQAKGKKWCEMALDGGCHTKAKCLCEQCNKLSGTSVVCSTCDGKVDNPTPEWCKSVKLSPPVTDAAPAQFAD